MYERTIHKLTMEESERAEENLALVYKYLYYRGLDIDEWWDVVIFGYLRAIQIHDESKGKLSTYSWKAMDRAVETQKRLSQNNVRKLNSSALSLDARVPSIADDFAEIEDNLYAVIGAEDENLTDVILSTDYVRFMETLSTLEKEVLQMRYNGKTYREIGKAFGVTRQWAWNITQKIGKKWNLYMKEAEA